MSELKKSIIKNNTEMWKISFKNLITLLIYNIYNESYYI